MLLGSWPVWILFLLIVLAGAGLAWVNVRRHGESGPAPLAMPRRIVIWGLQTLLASLLLLLLWRPALTVTALKPQQNVVAVLIDDSKSMALSDGGTSRSAAAAEVLKGGLLDKLNERFRTRLYRVGNGIERIPGPDALTAAQPVSRLGDALKQIAAESGSLPIGAVILLSDGADNSGGIDYATISEVRSRRIPVHTIGFGKEEMAKDVEVAEVVVAPRALADSRLSAMVTLRHAGFSGAKTRITVQEGGKILASKEVTLNRDGDQVEPVFFNAGIVGAKTLEVTAVPLEGEENTRNNTVQRLLNVENNKPRLLYIEGDPRWEFKFIRRAVEDDRTLALVSMVRTTQNKMYRQGIDSPDELAEGFPGTEEELFAYQGLIIGDVEAAYFSPKQLEMIRNFADRRGGGVLLLGGKDSLAEGGYQRSTLAEMLPVELPGRKGTFHRERAKVELTQAGRDSLLCRLEEDPEKNAARWGKMPELADWQEVGLPKPGALELLRTRGGPLLVSQNFGRGRVAVFATGGSWRWQMLQDLKDMTHETFWQQLLRWVASDSPGLVSVSTPRLVLSDETRLQLRAEVRNKRYEPVLDAKVEARLLGPADTAASVELRPAKDEPGVYYADWDARPQGVYLTEVTATQGKEVIAQDRLTFRREDGVAENFRTRQNRELLANLSRQTGGTYRQPGDAKSLADDLAYSEAGITMRESKDLWSMPIVFLLILALRSTEWGLRRKWGRI